MEAKLPYHSTPNIRIHDSPLSKEIQECEFLRKLLTPTFDCYFGVSDPVEHIRRDKMVMYFRNDPVMCPTFSSSLKGAVLDWFYSLPSRSLYNFVEVTEAFLTQYASRQEAKKNSHHLLSVKMRQRDRLKSYINFFQNQQTKGSNCGEEVFALVFIRGLSPHPLYRHLLKHVARISEILSRA